MEAQDVINSVTQDMRNQLQPTGTGASAVLDYVDRVQKDALHSGVYEYLNRATVVQATVAGQASYTLTPTNVRSVVTVYDRTTERLLRSLPDMVPVPANDPVAARDSLRIVTNAALPDFYRYVGGGQGTAGTLYLFATPLKVVNLEVHFTQQVPTLTVATTVLTIPDDGKDMVVAGVNFLAAMFLARGEEAKVWAGVYQMLKGAPSALVAAMRPEGA